MIWLIWGAFNVLAGWFGYKFAVSERGQVTGTFWVITILTLFLGVIVGWIIGFLMGMSKGKELYEAEQRKRTRERDIEKERASK